FENLEGDEWDVFLYLPERPQLNKIIKLPLEENITITSYSEIENKVSISYDHSVPYEGGHIILTSATAEVTPGEDEGQYLLISIERIIESMNYRVQAFFSCPIN